MAFSAPCPDLVSPLLEEHSWRGSCGSWQAAARLAVLNHAWSAQVDSWRGFERSVRLDHRADLHAIKVVARCCTNLQVLDLRGCMIKQLGSSLVFVAKACSQLRELLLGGCTALPTALRVKEWAQHCPQLQELDLSDWSDLCDGPVQLVGQHCRDLKRLNLSGCKRVTHGAIAALVGQLRGLVSLNLCDASKHEEQPLRASQEEMPEAVTDAASKSVMAIRGCSGLQKLHLRGNAASDAAVAEVLSHCTQLEELDLSSCINVTEVTLRAIAALPRLRRLCIADCPHIPGAAVANLWPEVASRWAAGWGWLDWRGDAQVPGGEPVAWLGPPPSARPSMLRGSHSVVGRTRTADIRIGHNWPMPYISSRHMRLYHWLIWPRPPATPHLAPHDRQPECEPWLVDLSQNGTFVNRKPVGVNRHLRLHDGDRVEVFNRELLRNRHDMSIPICFYRQARDADDLDP